MRPRAARVTRWRWASARFSARPTCCALLGGNHPLLRLPNALCTAHSAWLEKSTYELYFGEAFENAAAFAAGGSVKIVNPEALAGNRWI